MDDASSTSAPAETSPQITSEHLDPVPDVPPEQEWQTANPDQREQDRTHDNPPSAGVSQSRARSGKVKAEQQAFIPTTATTIDEVLRAAYFVANSIDAPTVEVVNPHVINLHYPADGSLATVKIEARSGAWGGLAHKGTPEQDAERNEHYDAQKAAAEAPAVPPEELARQEAHDDAHAREDAKPQEPREEENPVWEVQRQ